MLTLIVINSLICIGFYYSTMFFGWEDFDETPRDMKRGVKPEGKMIFWFVRYYGGIHLPLWLQKPLYLCPTCMASLHSIIPFALWSGDWLIYPLYILALAGLNSFIITQMK